MLSFCIGEFVARRINIVLMHRENENILSRFSCEKKSHCNFQLNQCWGEDEDVKLSVYYIVKRNRIGVGVWLLVKESLL